MAYCTADDVEARVPGGRLEPYLRNTEVDVRAQISAAQAEEIDPVLKSMGYDVPFTDGEVPDMVVGYTAWKVVELLCFRIPSLMQWHDMAERKVQRIEKQLRTKQMEPPDDRKSLTYLRQDVVVSGQAERRFTEDKLSRM